MSTINTWETSQIKYWHNIDRDHGIICPLTWAQFLCQPGIIYQDILPSLSSLHRYCLYSRNNWQVSNIKLLKSSLQRKVSDNDFSYQTSWILSKIKRRDPRAWNTEEILFKFVAIMLNLKNSFDRILIRQIVLANL